MYCKSCRKNVRNISHWAKTHRRRSRKKTRGKAPSRRLMRSERSGIPVALLRRFRRACAAFYGK